MSLDAAILASLPAPTFHDLFLAVSALVPDLAATNLDSAARRLGLEQGEPGAYHYALPTTKAALGPSEGRDGAGL